MARRLGEPLLVGRLERDVEERPRHAKAAVVLAQHGDGAARRRAPRRRAARAVGHARARPSLRRARSSPSSARRTARRATARRRLARCETGVDHGFPLVRPGTVRRCVLRPGEPELRERADERVEPSSPDALAIRLRLARHGRSKPPRTPRPPPARAVSAPPGLDDPDQCASGRGPWSPSARGSRPRISASAIPSPMPIVRPLDVAARARRRDRDGLVRGNRSGSDRVGDDGSVRTRRARTGGSFRRCGHRSPASSTAGVGFGTTSARSRASIGFAYSPSPYRRLSPSLRASTGRAGVDAERALAGVEHGREVLLRPRLPRRARTSPG